ncbi:hypothetical protein PENSTE_c002G10402 [Penicillium steckii]|uniref:Rhodopsin domain-containing protein n=1 Tax=Penicillium steckii TaxID=303698 RepID=A0A1V6TTW2_9EURO|nr:hypothetical protein PENSTE_c002G10402 [Penicillium steckii]
MSSTSEDLRPPLLPVTVNDHGAWVITVSTILLILTILATVVTAISRTLFIPQTVCINVASSNGIGKRHEALSQSSFRAYEKAFYSSQLLAVIVVACSKAALALLVLSLKPFSRIVLACKVFLGLICGWAVAALFALGLQCEQPSPWDSSHGRCVNQYALYVILGVTHTLLDLAVIALPVALLWQVQIPRRKRFNISALFASRILVVVLTVPGIRSLQPYFHAKPLDQPWHALMPAIWLQLVQSTSILCTCLPTLKRVLSDLQTGMMAGTVSDFFETSVSGEHATLDGSSKSGSRIGQRSRSGSAMNSQGGFHRSRPQIERMDSRRILRENIIHQSIDYEVRYEDSGPLRASSTSHDFDSIQGESSGIHPSHGV